MTPLLDVARNAVPARLFVPLTPQELRDIRVENSRREKRQTEGFESQEIFKSSIESKLLKAGCDETWFRNMRRCGREHFFTLCVNCQRLEEKYYQCSNKICPRCNWRIAMRRRDLLAKITAGMPETILHVVLTQRNFYDNLTTEIKKSRANLLKLRRQKIFGKISGGCASMEITNEKKGWHLHWHLLVAATGYVPADKLAVIWGKLVGQEFAIVKIKAVREGSYLQEVCKYAAKGSDIAKWQPTEIANFANAVHDVRLFTVFGKFQQVRKIATAAVAADRAELKKPCCPCGCDTQVYGNSEAACIRALEEGRF